MQFTEIGFALFLLVVFTLYWFVARRHVRGRNLLVLASSYLFYGWWDWRFLLLIILTTLSTYVTALYGRGKHGRLLTGVNIALNLGILAAFKYLGFFVENLQRLLGAFGWNIDWFTVEVLLPVGISFYTFQAIGYSIDVCRGEVKPCRDLLSFATFIAYFPQLVAGPIERASALLPQLQSIRPWNRRQAVSGLQMILYGVVKKVALADMLAVYTDRLFLEGNLVDPKVTLIAGILFSLQIYCDFSAYSEIARGTSRLLGVELMANFRFPYFSRNVVEFWRRWHISLMMWFRDYLYIPLGGNRRGKARTYLNIAVVFLLSGLWHGAAWNFIVWGAYWAVVNIFCRLTGKVRDPKRPIEIRDLPQICVTFIVVTFGFYIFRCSDWSQMGAGFANVAVYAIAAVVLWAIMYGVRGLVVRGLEATATKEVRGLAVKGLEWGVVIGVILFLVAKWPWSMAYYTWLPALVIVWIEWRDRNTDHPYSTQSRMRIMRWGMYWLLMLFALLSEPIDMNFIYFQF